MTLDIRTSIMREDTVVNSRNFESAILRSQIWLLQFYSSSADLLVVVSAVL